MNTIWTPLEIHILLHYHASATQFYRPSQACHDFTNKLVDMGLLERYEGDEPLIYKTTEKGEALVEYILNTPGPTIEWVIKRS